MKRILTLLLLLSSPAFGQAYTDAMYRRALEDHTTSPLYVLVTLRDNATDSERVVCVQAPLLLGAIHLEYGFGYDDAGSRRALDVAMAQPGRTFSFTDERARANFPPFYSRDALAAVRRRFELVPELALRAQLRDLSDRDNPLRAFVDSTMSRDAVAHALLERGILVGSADITGQVYVAE